MVSHHWFLTLTLQVHCVYIVDPSFVFMECMRVCVCVCIAISLCLYVCLLLFFSGSGGAFLLFVFTLFQLFWVVFVFALSYFTLLLSLRFLFIF